MPPNSVHVLCNKITSSQMLCLCFSLISFKFGIKSRNVPSQFVHCTIQELNKKSRSFLCTSGEKCYYQWHVLVTTCLNKPEYPAAYPVLTLTYDSVAISWLPKRQLMFGKQSFTESRFTLARSNLSLEFLSVVFFFSQTQMYRKEQHG